MREAMPRDSKTLEETDLLTVRMSYAPVQTKKGIVPKSEMSSFSVGDECASIPLKPLAGSSSPRFLIGTLFHTDQILLLHSFCVLSFLFSSLG